MRKLPRLFDLRDLFVFGGLGLLGYGLWLYRPWVAFAVCGALLFLLGMVPAPGTGRRP